MNCVGLKCHLSLAFSHEGAKRCLFAEKNSSGQCVERQETRCRRFFTGPSEDEDEELCSIPVCGCAGELFAGMAEFRRGRRATYVSSSRMKLNVIC